MNTKRTTAPTSSAIVPPLSRRPPDAPWSSLTVPPLVASHAPRAEGRSARAHQRRDDDAERQRAPVRHVHVDVPEEQHQQPRRRERGDEEHDDEHEQHTEHRDPPPVTVPPSSQSGSAVGAMLGNRRRCGSMRQSTVAGSTPIPPASLLAYAASA